MNVRRLVDFAVRTVASPPSRLRKVTTTCFSCEAIIYVCTDHPPGHTERPRSSWAHLFRTRPCIQVVAHSPALRRGSRPSKTPHVKLALLLICVVCAYGTDRISSYTALGLSFLCHSQLLMAGHYRGTITAAVLRVYSKKSIWNNWRATAYNYETASMISIHC